MLCCALYEGWSHLSCMGMKEGVGVMVERQLLTEEQGGFRRGRGC